MDLWQSRKQSHEWLSTKLIEQNSLVDNGFVLLDKCIALLNQYNKTSDDELNGRFARAVNLTLAKTRNLLLGSYSMMLDALAQEAGALLRLILEAYELLIYFRLEPKRVNQVIDDKLPKPGEIAKKIKGEFQGLREYLNANASHLSFNPEISKHLFDFQKSEVRAVQIQTVDVLERNMSTLNAFQIFVVAEAIGCLHTIGHLPESIINEYEDWRSRSIKASPFPTNES